MWLWLKEITLESNRRWSLVKSGTTNLKKHFSLLDTFWHMCTHLYTNRIKIWQPACISVYVGTLSLHHQDRNSENSPVCIIIAVAEWLYLVYVRVCMTVCICARRCLYSCGRWGGCSGLWKTGGLTRMYGCFKIHLQAFFHRHSLLLSLQSTPYPTSTHTRTLQQQPSFCHYVYYYSILPELTNQKRA